MKKFLGFSAVVFLFSMCSTEMDLLDEWKETTVVYGMLDQSQPKQYIRIQKAFLGPNNAYDMAQQYDSINYVNGLDVRMERLTNNDGLVDTLHLAPDTFYNKQPGDFYAPMYVIYSFTPPAGWLSTAYKYRLVINNASSGNEVTSTSRVVGNYDIIQPNFGTIGFASNNVNYKVEIKWDPATNAERYQVMAYFYYTEIDINSVGTSKVTSGWFISDQYPTGNSVSDESVKFEPDGFYRFVSSEIDVDDNIVERRSDSIKFYVYACGAELNDYMNINGPSSSIVQERPQYTNITNGVGVFSARTSASRSYTLANQSLDSLSRGRFTCTLKFLDHNGDNLGCQ
jgi:hypothetical protein